MKETIETTTNDSQALLNQLLIEHLREQRKKKKWRFFMRVVALILVLYGAYKIFSFNNDEAGGHEPHVGMIDLNGEIADTKVNADDFAKSLNNAYKSDGLQAVILRINSPGGSPVQAEYMYNLVKFYQKKHPNVKVYAVCMDLCASAAYYLAVAADEIYASPSSMVGSIGVLYNGFGFVDLMSKVGVTRRLEISGSNKGFMDPFSPVTDAQKAKLQTMLDIVHQLFIDRVKEGRKKRLHINDDVFSGLFWTGQQALAMGLIDGFGSSGQVARDVIKLDRVVDYTHKQNLLDKVAKGIGASIADELPKSLGLDARIR
jgi:protease-4